MKKIIMVLAIVSLGVLIAGCGKKENSVQKLSPEDLTAAEQKWTESAKTRADIEKGKIDAEKLATEKIKAAAEMAQAQKAAAEKAAADLKK